MNNIESGQNEIKRGRWKVLKTKTPTQWSGFNSVDPLGLEPRLFGTKNRRVANYTIGHLFGKFMKII